jgi:hypothetical protein
MQARSSDHFQIYDHIPHCRIVYKVERGTLVGRALLWDCVEPYKIKVMDRIYASDYAIEQVFKKWARDNGYFYKSSQSSGLRNFIEPVTSTTYLSDEYYIETGDLTELNLTAVPYMDTFYGYSKYGRLSTSGHYDTFLQETDGTDSQQLLVDSGDRHCCFCCGENSSEGITTLDGHFFCDICAQDELVYVECC